MKEENNVYQGKEEVEDQEFSERAFVLQQNSVGFNTPAKAKDPSLAQRQELSLGNLTDQELVKELHKLERYLRADLELFQTNTYLHHLLIAAQHRIQYLSGTLDKREKASFIDQENLQGLSNVRED